MQQELRWRYYNHAIIPSTAPHERVDESPMKSGDLWKAADGCPLLARWTTDFDCREATDWWYIIKDKPFDMMDVGCKHRKTIRKGIKYFDVRIIDPVEYAEELYQVELEAVSEYPSKCREKVDHDQFIASLNDRRNGITFAAFSKEDNSMAGYLYDIVRDSYIEGLLLKAKPSQKKKQLSSALVFCELDYFRKELEQGVYIMAGERTIYHPTNHQEYLEKTFGFRKAYSRLHIRYRRGIKQMVACLYPMRGLISKLDCIKLFSLISGVLKMEEIVRQYNKSRPMNGSHGDADLARQPLRWFDRKKYYDDDNFYYIPDTREV